MKLILFVGDNDNDDDYGASLLAKESHKSQQNHPSTPFWFFFLLPLHIRDHEEA